MNLITIQICYTIQFLNKSLAKQLANVNNIFSQTCKDRVRRKEKSTTLKNRIKAEHLSNLLKFSAFFFCVLVGMSNIYPVE